ncbi:MAG: septum formation initiator family protein [Bacteroidales bacterium]|jgi:cell division protein DivIC|nr:septum formation initiator family protein [Paludibacteraceae bacterium]NLK92287.1 septum formation initiator family protein [Bacteroidales bacterium]MBP8628088.1 septum formation initiator family protein [Paludibacteraceae bacterium]MBP8782287.1 septum formation initiator family protein [Paludibacteraceae bacterium]MBP9649081.1 septum formation initiator family protein [Paludibacteraceae bacterium]
MKKIVDFFITYILNKYVIASAVFVFVMFTNEDYNIKTRYANAQKIKKLEAEIRYYQEETKKNKEKLDLLQSDKENLERFAREQFIMKKDSEDVFVVVD